MIFKKVFLAFTYNLKCPYFGWCINDSTVKKKNRNAFVLPLQSYPTLCNPMDCSPSGPSVHGTLQAKTLEWVAMPSSAGSFQLRDWTWISYFSCTGRWVLYHLGSHMSIFCQIYHFFHRKQLLIKTLLKDLPTIEELLVKEDIIWSGPRRSKLLKKLFP